jgi:hypothetical protein
LMALMKRQSSEVLSKVPPCCGHAAPNVVAG